MGDVAAIGMVRPTTIPGILWPPLQARRCLFGAPDSESTRTLLETETKRIQQECKKRWNFDFVEGKPLKAGRYTWTPVPPGTNEDGAESAQNDTRKEQTLITDFMRKRKASSSNNGIQKEEKKTAMTPKSKRRRRSST